MDLLTTAYTGEALGNVWKRMKAAWAKDTPTSDLTTVLTRKVQEIFQSLPPFSQDAATFKGYLEQSLAETGTGKILLLLLDRHRCDSSMGPEGLYVFWPYRRPWGLVHLKCICIEAV